MPGLKRHRVGSRFRLRFGTGAVVLHNEAISPLACDIGPHPLQEDGQTEARCREELEVHGRPSEPRPEPTRMDLAGFQHSKTFTHHGHAAIVKVVKWARCGLAGDPAVNQLPT